MASLVSREDGSSLPPDIFPLTQKSQFVIVKRLNDAGWSSLEARRAHNPKVAGSNPAPATK
jgi:hypothetical protein